MRRISPVLVLLLAAGCANAGIGDWLNPFKVFGGKHPHGGPGSPSGVQHSPHHSGHRGPRQLHSSGPSGPSHAPQSSPQLGSPPGHLDDGFKPSFPPGFANPPSHSPNLNPFANSAGPGAETLGKGPFLPSQLTNYHTPNPSPHTPLVKPAPAPSHGGVGPRHRGRFPFGGKGRRPMPPHAAVASGSSVPDGTGPVGPDGQPVDYSDYPGLSSPISPPSGQAPEYEETPTTPPESAPQRGPRQSLFQRLTGRRPSGPPPSYNSQRHQSHQYGGRPHHGGPGGPGSGGPPSGPPGGPDGPSYIDGSGSEGGNPFGNSGPLSGPPGGRPGSDVFYASSPGSSQGFIPSNPDQGHNGPSPFANPQSGPGGPSPFGSGGSSPYGNALSGNPSSSGGPSYSGGPGGPGGQYSSGPGGPGGPSYSGGQGGPGGPYSSGPGGQGGPSYSGGPGGPGGPFGGPSESGPQGPPGGPGGPGGPSFFNGNDYPEQYEGGPRGPRQPSHLSPGDFRPQINGPPETAGADEQNPGFYGALHSENGGGPQLSSFFGGGGQEGGPGGPPSYSQGPSNNSPFGNSGGPPSLSGNSPGIYSGSPSPNGQPGYLQRTPQRKPPIRSFLRNPLAAAFGSSSNNVPAYGNPLAMSASGHRPSTLPVPKGSRLLRPFQRKPGVIIPLNSPKDPNYRPMRLGASSLSPVTAPFEPDTAASGGYHGGYGNVGLSPNGDRILYHVAGHQGPHSYQFGFDTGKGYNRIFRFEEKDGKGYVKGKYGFYDKHGKLNIINYQAHPQHGYQAERGHSHGYY